MTPFDDFIYLVNSILLGEEPVSLSLKIYYIVFKKKNLLTQISWWMQKHTNEFKKI